MLWRIVHRAIVVQSLTVTALALALFVPVNMIRDLIAERQARRHDAVAGIALGWGRRQVLAGPYLVIPYERDWTEISRETIDGTPKERRTERHEALRLRVPPDRVSWSITVVTREKRRGIYTARLYSARVEAHADVTLPALPEAEDAQSRIRWGTARVVLGIADPRGIRSISALRHDGTETIFAAGAGDSVLADGVHADLGLRPGPVPRKLGVEYSLELAGSEALAVAPLALDTRVAMRADWPHPAFDGEYLPVRSEIGAGGFSAQWLVSRYASRGAERLAACRHERCAGLGGSQFGVSFIEPVGLYLQLERASKYGFLFIGLTFVAVLLVELLRRLKVHPIQYALIGLAVAIFFLLLTALSEQVGFGPAYALATVACVGIVTLYAVRVLHSAALGVGFGAALAALYGTLYLLLHAEDYALIGGAFLLFTLLAACMLATRNVDWFEMTRLGAAPGESVRSPTADRS
jgi:inner membrane protein